MKSTVELPDWAEPLFDESFRYFAIKGGRGSSKSRSVASVLVVRGSAKPLRILCGREIQKSIKDSVKRLIDDEIKRRGLEDFYESTETEIRGKNGTLFLFTGLRSNIDSVKSMEGIDICWIEEAQVVSHNSLTTLTPTIRKPGSQLYFTWNAKFDTDPVEVMFCGDDMPPRTHFDFVNYDRNPWFPDVLKEEMEADKKRDYDKYLHVWEGGYLKSSESRVFKNWKVEEFESPKDAVLRLGADFGFAVDPTVLIRAYAQDRRLFIEYEAYQVGCEIVNTPDLFLTVPESERWPIVADSARPETISHLRKNGFPKILSAVKGPKSLEEGVEWLKSYDIVVHPRCVHTIEELTLYSYKKDTLTDMILPILEDKHNHLIDALRYAFESIRRTATNKPKISKPVQTVNRW